MQPGSKLAYIKASGVLGIAPGPQDKIKCRGSSRILPNQGKGVLNHPGVKGLNFRFDSQLHHGLGKDVISPWYYKEVIAKVDASWTGWPYPASGYRLQAFPEVMPTAPLVETWTMTSERS